jgi:hypothetical protein
VPGLGGKLPWHQQSLKPGEELELGSQQLDLLSPKGDLNAYPHLLVSNPAMPAVSALATEQALIPTTAGLDILNANQRLWSHHVASP